MLTISARDFQLHQKDYMDKLPVVLTVYGKPVAYVLKELPEPVIEIVPTEQIPEELKEQTGTLPVENINAYGAPDGKDYEVISMWCQLHFEAKKNYPCVKISYEDENGTELVKEKWACPKCLEGYQRKGVGRVYFL